MFHMNPRTTVLTASLTAVLAVSMVATPALATHAAYLDLTKGEVKDDGTSVKFEVTVAGDLEDAANDGALFGFVALTGDFQDMLALTTHIPIDDNGADDDGPSGFHTHIVDVIGNCADGLKVSASGFSPAQDSVEVKGNSIEANGVDSTLTGEFSGTIASFTIHLEGSDVCVVVDDAIATED